METIRNFGFISDEFQQGSCWGNKLYLKIKENCYDKAKRHVELQIRANGSKQSIILRISFFPLDENILLLWERTLIFAQL